MKKLPVGIQTFSEIIADGYCYVDKTALIYRLLTQGKYYFLSRPRRFGKSLLLDTIAEVFHGSKELFSGLSLHNQWDWTKTYPVIRLDFSEGNIAGRDRFEQRILRILNIQAEQHNIALTCDYPDDCFEELILTLHKKYNAKVVVLIDEYDRPIFDNILHKPLAAELREVLKNFYSVIKSQDAHLRFAMLTGVSKFAKVSLFSGLNNLEDISLDPRFGTICGYTHHDVHTVFTEHLGETNPVELEKWYNGYNFLSDPVYNPFDVLLYLRNKIFKNYWFETGTPTFLLDILRRKQFSVPSLDLVQVSEQLLSSFDVDRIEPETLLFQTGYLTIKEQIQEAGGRIIYRLGLPNHEVRMSLTDAILDNYVHDIQQKERTQNALFRAIASGEPKGVRRAFASFFASIPYNWYIKNEIANYEGYYSAVVYSYFTALGFDVIPEDVTNKDRMDLTVRFKDDVFIIEFKLFRKNQTPGEALAQIKQKKYAEKYAASSKRIWILGMEFDPVKRNISHFQWEKFR